MALQKQAVIDLFDGNISRMGRELGISRKTIHAWPDELPQRIEDQVRGAIARIHEERDKQVVNVFGGA